jgi:hypothetical protein
MKQTDIVKRAFQLTLHQPVLWIFGILLALTGGGRGSEWVRYVFGNNGSRRAPLVPAPGAASLGPGFWITVALVSCCVLLVVIVVAIIVRYVSLTALYRLIDRIEEVGGSPTWREGFRLGWSNRAFRAFLLELIVGLAVLVGALILLAIAASPLLLLLIRSAAARTIGISLAVVLGLLWIAVLLIAAVILSVLLQFWSREIILADRSIGEAFSGGYRLVRAKIVDVGLMWLLLFAIRIGWVLVLVPIAIVVTLAAASLGAMLGFSAYGVTHSIGWGLAAGVPIFLVILLVPLTFLGGLYRVFDAGAWTLAYREVARPNPLGDNAPAPALA